MMLTYVLQTIAFFDDFIHINITKRLTKMVKKTDNQANKSCLSF